MRIALQRELRAGARRSGTYWARIFAGVLAALALFQDASGTFAGRTMFFTAYVLAFIACIFEGVRRGAGAIADERNEGTLGLLFLTNLSGPELMIGKYLAIGLSAFQMALAATPVLAASLLLGGISVAEFARSAIGLWHALLLSICLSVIASVHATDPVRVMTRTWVAIIFSVIILFPLSIFVRPIGWANPLTPVSGITDGNYGGGRANYWISLLLYQALAIGSLYLAGRRLFRNWQKAEEARYSAAAIHIADEEPERFSSHVPARSRVAPRWFKENPMEWLTLRDVRLHKGRWGVLLLIVIGAALALGAPELAWVVGALAFGSLILGLSVTSTRVIAGLQQSGAMELILTTPLGERGIMKGHRRALHKLFFWPFVVSLATLIVFGVRAKSGDQFVFFYITAGLIMLYFATPWIGLLVGLRSKNPRRAVLWTELLVVILPRFGFCFLADPIYFAIFGIAAWIYVRRNFRRLAAERFMAG